VVVKFTLVDRVLEIPKYPINFTNSSQEYSLKVPSYFSQKGNQPQKGIPTQNGERIQEREETQQKEGEHQQGEEEHQEEQNKEGVQKNENVQKEGAENGRWEIPRSWEAAVKMYGKYTLFLFMIIQVVWAMVVREDRIVRRKLVAVSQSAPPSNVVNNL
jgi:hypothetical protein